MAPTDQDRLDLLADFLRQRFENSPLGRNMVWDAQSDRIKDKWRAHARDFLTLTNAFRGSQSISIGDLSIETLARALRADNIEGNGHPMDSWEDAEKKTTLGEPMTAMWIRRAERFNGYLQAEIERSKS